MTRRTPTLIALPFLGMVCGATTPAVPGPAEVQVTVTGLRSDKGLVRACMTSHEASFPQCRGDATAYSASARAHEGRLTLSFPNVRPGRYAIALLHDENGNGKADRALGMMPKEGFGFSRDAPVRMGPPRFDEAALDLGNGDRTVEIRMRYML